MCSPVLGQHYSDEDSIAEQHVVRGPLTDQYGCTRPLFYTQITSLAAQTHGGKAYWFAWYFLF